MAYIDDDEAMNIKTNGKDTETSLSSRQKAGPGGALSAFSMQKGGC
jgi:hypothetical protein